MSNDIQPEIRFPGFTDDWEERKLKELFQPSKNKNNNGLYNQKDILAASLGTELIPKRTFFGLKSTRESVKNYRIVKTGDLIYTKSPIKGFPNGIIRSNKGNVGIVPPLYCVYTLQKDINSSIIQLYFEDKNRLDFYLFPLVNVGARNNVNITDLEFLEGKVTIPKSYEEQSKIVQFMEQLNTTIALHQRKLDLLKETKKGFLQKMFPKNGAKVPEIRFPGFTEDWEQRKLGQVANYRRGSFPQPYGNKEWYDGENSMPFVQVVDVGDNLRLVEDTKQKISELAQPKSVFVEEGKVVVTLQGSIGRVAITQYPAYVDRTLLIFESYKAEMDEYYFAYVIQQLFEYEKTRAPGGTIKTITKEALSNFTISFPSIAEQKKLGKFFEQFDHTIMLHQHELDLLKETKKGFLQKMFV